MKMLHEFRYGVMISTEMGMGLPGIIPFRMRQVPPPDKNDPTKCSLCKLPSYKCECQGEWVNGKWIKED